jgi:hypothetical protein
MATRNDYYFLSREQAFFIEINGLIPLTEHYVYFEQKLAPAGKMKPWGKKTGEALITDRTGYLAFEYFYDSGLSTTAAYSLSEAQKQQTLVSGHKNIVVGSTSVATLPSTYDKEWLSYWSSHIVVTVQLP